MRTERPWAGVDEAMDKLRAAVDAFEASGGTNVRTLVDPLEALEALSKIFYATYTIY
jgi:hypothetical protein